MRQSILIILLFVFVTAKPQNVQIINNHLKEYDYFSDCCDGYVIVKKEGMYGFYNIDNHTFSPCAFEKVTNFSEGKTWVIKDGCWSIYDNAEIVPTNFVRVLPFSDQRSLVQKGTYNVYVDSTAKIVIENDFENAKSFNEGLAPVYKNRKWGFIDIYGNWVIPPTYLETKQFSQGLAAVRDENGWFYVDKKGIPFTTKRFKSVSSFSEGAAIVHEGLNPTMSIINIDQSFVPFYASKIGEFHNGIANYQISPTHEIIQGRTVSIPKGKYGYIIHNEDYNPTASMKISISERYGDTPKEQIINSKYYTLIAPVFDYVLDFTDGYGAVCINKKWTYVNKHGEYLCLPKLDEAHPFSNGIAKVTYQGNTFFIDTLGNCLPPELKENLDSLSIELQAQNVFCWMQDAQYEQALKESIRLYNYTTQIRNNIIPELSANELRRANDLLQIANQSKKYLISFFEQKMNSASNVYRGIQAPKRMSFQSNSPYLNMENGKDYIDNYFKENNDSTDLLIKQCYERKEYERAAYLISKKIKISEKIPSDLWRLYFYTAQISGMSMLVNQLTPEIYEYIDVNKIGLNIDISTAIWLSESKRFQSANIIYNNLYKKEKDNFKKAIILHNWGLANQSYGDYKSSFKHLLKALKLYSNIHTSRTDALYLEALSSLFACSNEISNSELKQYIQDYTNKEIDFSTNLFCVNDIREAGKNWEFSLRRINRFLNTLDRVNSQSFINASFLMNNFKNSIQLNVLSKFNEIVSNETDVEVQETYNIYKKQKENYQGLSPFCPLFSSEEWAVADQIYKTEKLLKDMVASKYHNYISLEKFKTLPNILQDSEIAIDIVEYTDSLGLKRYGAFVFNHQTKSPKFVKLFDSQHYGENGTEYIDEISGKSFNFWTALMSESELNSTKNIYLSLGPLTNFGWEYLRTNDNPTPIMLRFNINRVQNIANLSTGTKDIIKKNDIALFGAIDYSTTNISKKRGGINSGKLLYSKDEIDNIVEILKGTFNVNDIQCYSDSRGTVDNFLALDNKSPQIIHMSTHGVQESIENKWFDYTEFISGKDDKIQVEEIDWLLNSTGLLMSPEKVESDTIKILKSYQISKCNLSNTNLVVMSACNTSSGKSSDAFAGPMGLNFAFQMASTKNIISTLDDIDDQIASDFMTIFYRNKIKLNSNSEAFKETVREMYNDYPDDPEYWSTFIYVKN